MIYIIDSDPILAKCVAAATGQKCCIFDNTISALSAISERLPHLLILDILLKGPDGFTLLNELASYEDTAQIPVVILSSLNFRNCDLSEYGVVQILNKDTFTPDDIRKCVEYA